GTRGGGPPCAGPDATAVLGRGMHERPAPPRAVVSGVPRALQAVCLKALAKRPADRYARALDLAADIKHFLADEPVTAYREPLAARAGRWARRHRTAVTTVGGLLLTAGVGPSGRTVGV